MAGNGRPTVGGSLPYSRNMNVYADADMEAQIHLLEQEAYSSILRAFKAQADAITWVLFNYSFSFVNLISVYVFDQV